MTALRSTTAVIDDDPLFHWIIENRLESFQSGAKLLRFENGRKALEHLKNNRHKPEELPDKILLDLFMPEMDGLEFLDALGEVKSSIDKHIAIFVTTVSMDPHHRELVAQHPEVDGYFIKPLTEPAFRTLYPEVFKKD